MRSGVRALGALRGWTAPTALVVAAIVLTAQPDVSAASSQRYAPYRVSGTVVATYGSTENLAASSGGGCRRRGTITAREQIAMRISPRTIYGNREHFGNFYFVHNVRRRGPYTRMDSGIPARATYTAVGTSTEEVSDQPPFVDCDPTSPPAWRPQNRPDPAACGSVRLRHPDLGLFYNPRFRGQRERADLELPMPLEDDYSAFRNCTFFTGGSGAFGKMLADYSGRSPSAPSPSARSVRRILRAGRRSVALSFQRSYRRSVPRRPPGNTETLDIRVKLGFRRVGRWRSRL